MEDGMEKWNTYKTLGELESTLKYAHEGLDVLRDRINAMEKLSCMGLTPEDIEYIRSSRKKFNEDYGLKIESRSGIMSYRANFPLMIVLTLLGSTYAGLFAFVLSKVVH